MKRKKQKSKTQKKHEQPSAPAQAKPARSLNRRDVLGNVAFSAAALAAIGAGGWYLIGGVSASISEGDLTKIGNGIPTVVQIHDPNCPTCTALQREARDAICEMDSGKIQYVVANLNKPDGRLLAAKHGVGKVTLLLFDGDGNRQATLSGPNTSTNLKLAFERHIRKYGNS